MPKEVVIFPWFSRREAVLVGLYLHKYGSRLIDTENKPVGARREVSWAGYKSLKGLESTNWQLQNGHRDVKYSTGNIVDNIVITVYGARWLLNLRGYHFANYINV